MVKRTVPRGSSKTAERRFGKASFASRTKDMRRLVLRGMAYRSLSTGMPWQERLRKANAALRSKRLQKKLEQEETRQLDQKRLENEARARALDPYFLTSRDV